MTPNIAPSGVEKPIKSCGIHGSAPVLVSPEHKIEQKKASRFGRLFSINNIVYS